MESKRGYFILGLAICTFLLYQAWQKDYGPKPEQPAKQENVAVTSDGAIAEESNLITVSTDLLNVKINKVGGDIVYAETLNYKVKIKDDKQQEKVVLFDYRNRQYQAKSAVLGNGAPDNQIPRASYTASQNNYNLTANEPLSVVLSWDNGSGVMFTKTFTFNSGSYSVGVNYQIDNQSDNDRTYNFIAELVRDQKETGLEEKGAFGMSPFLGVAYSPEEEKYEKMDFEDLAEEPINVSRQGGWISFIQHYFISAWIPPQDSQITITGKMAENGYAKIQYIAPALSVPAKSTKNIGSTLYVGPKDLNQMEAAAPGLEKTMDLSWVWWIGLPLYKLLTFFEGLVSNWGIAIIMITLVVKTLLYPLSAAQYKSTASMRKLQPKMQKLKERYGEDKQKMQQEMMKMYKEEGANPFGGCLPMLLQFPIFIALYYVLFEAVELRHAPFFGWITDLSIADPFFVLPLLMGGSMWMMQKMQPTAATMDPMQQKMMQYLPVLMTVFMLFFPAGLVLYWLCNNLISISQQKYVTNKIEKQDLLNIPKKKKK